jgi:hypothetical protein
MVVLTCIFAQTKVQIEIVTISTFLYLWELGTWDGNVVYFAASIVHIDLLNMGYFLFLVFFVLYLLRNNDSILQQKHNLPQNPNFRKTLGSKLRRLVSQGKLEKVN